MEDAQLHLSCDEWPSVEQVVKVLPAGLAHVPIIDALVHLQNVRDACLEQVIDTPAFLSALGSLQAPVRDIVQATCELLNGLQRFDVNAVCTSGARLEVFGSSSTHLPGRSQRLLVKLAQFAQEFGRTSLHEWTLPAFFIHDDASPQYRNWWKQPSSLAGSFERTHARFPAILTGSVPDSLQKVRKWIGGFKEQATGLHLEPTSTQTEADVFRQASAFMAMSADVHHANHSHILALICLHRAVEWLLAAKCADQNLLDFTSTTGVRMRSGDLLSFDTLLTAFAQQGLTLNGMMNDLVKLNSWRNLFAYTHHMSCPRTTEAESLFRRIRVGLPTIANNQWKATVKVLSEPWPVSLEDMLDPAGEVRDTYSVHSADSLIL
ncbi:hypothetical protein [Pseudomonas kurunegalensis]|uniref:hypothetical protein n=1 Tax=Pseudomonas TaxID=286 RepID=UPI003558EA85